MFTRDEYELLDFGDGRKLERFGRFVLDRPCPTAESTARARPKRWNQADARYERTRGKEGAWGPVDVLPAVWTVRHGALTFELKAAPFGHVGLFPEQADNWDWIAQQVSAAHQAAQHHANLHGESGRRCKVLNLFAYTGGSTLAAAAAGAEVVHVDAAKNTVAWARRNAKRSGLAEAPIRWIAEDAAKFVTREIRRGSAYDAIILDPPTYGHDPRGKAWRIERDLPPLVRGCLQVTRGAPRFLLLTCHSEELSGKELIACLHDNGLHGNAAISADELAITSIDGRKLLAGVAVRVMAKSRPSVDEAEPPSDDGMRSAAPDFSVSRRRRQRP